VRAADCALELNCEVLLLDLCRVGKSPQVEKLCAEEARDPVQRERAYRRVVR
jgi:hypothetical protein